MDENNINQNDVEDLLLRSMSKISFEAYASQLEPHSNYLRISDGPTIPTSFKSAFRHLKWSDSICRFYISLMKRNNWKYVKLTKYMNPVPFKWIFNEKQLDRVKTSFLFKSRCVLCRDNQHEYI